MHRDDIFQRWIRAQLPGPPAGVGPWYRITPVTCTFVALIIVIFATTWLVGGADLVWDAFSASEATADIILGEWWRLLTCGLVHSSWYHVLSTSIFVLLGGMALEAAIGSVALVELLVLSIVVGAVNCAIFEAGGGGAVLAVNGIFGALATRPPVGGPRRLLSPHTWWPLVVLIFVETTYLPSDALGPGGQIASVLTGVSYGAILHPGCRSGVLRIIRAARRALSFVASRLSEGMAR